MFSLGALECCVLTGRLGYVDDGLRGWGRNVGECCFSILSLVNEDFTPVSLVILDSYEVS